MRNVLTIAMLLLMCGSLLRADGADTSSVSMDDIVAKKLLPTLGVDGYVFPSFKFFEHDQLSGILSGAPTANRTLDSALYTLPAEYKNPPLKDELATVRFGAPVSAKTVLVYTQSVGCPPCNDIIGRVKQQLAGVGWGKAQILIVDVVIPGN